MESSKLLQIVVVALVVLVVYVVITDQGGVGPSPDNRQELWEQATRALDAAERGDRPGPNPRPGPDDRRTEDCPQCNGRGEYSPDHSGNFYVRCDRCNGTGKLTTGSEIPMAMGEMGQETPPGWNPDCTCPECNCGENCTCGNGQCSCQPFLYVVVGENDEQSITQLENLEAVNQQRKEDGLPVLDVRPLDVVLHSSEISKLWDNVEVQGGKDENGVPLKYPAYILMKGGVPIKWYAPLSGNSTLPNWEAMLNPESKVSSDDIVVARNLLAA